jgi:hypothetical protein
MSIARLIPVLLCSAALVGCEGASEPEFNVPDPTLDEAENTQNENPFLGAWRATSAVVGDDELLPPGPHFSYIMTFWGDEFWVSVSGDVGSEICPGQDTSCGWPGTYDYTRTTITTLEPDHPNPEERGEDTAFYVFCSNKLIFFHELDDGDDGGGIRLTYERTRRDCYARDCE